MNRKTQPEAVLGGVADEENLYWINDSLASVFVPCVRVFVLRGKFYILIVNLSSFYEY